jgi:hypothetical protein
MQWQAIVLLFLLPPLPRPSERKHDAQGSRVPVHRSDYRGNPWPQCKFFLAGLCERGKKCRWNHHAKSGNASLGGPAARDGGPPCASRYAPSSPAHQHALPRHPQGAHHESAPATQARLTPTPGPRFPPPGVHPTPPAPKAATPHDDATDDALIGPVPSAAQAATQTAATTVAPAATMTVPRPQLPPPRRPPPNPATRLR